MTGNRILEVDGLGVELDVGSGSVHPVRDVTFSLRQGEAMGIVGESGSGKSMTALALMRLLPSNLVRASGRVRLGGTEISALPPGQFAREIAGKRIGMIFQDPMTSLNPVYTIGRQLVETMLMGGERSEAKARERAVYLLDRVGLTDAPARLSQYPHQLSGGLRQRVMIAMALMNSPELIIADEPTTALDVTIQARILKLLAELQRELGTAMILITHDIGVVAQAVDRIGVMYAGELVEEGPTGRILTAPLHPYTQGLLDCIPRAADTHARRLGSIPGLVPSLLGKMNHCGFANRCPHAHERCWQAAPALVTARSGGSFRCVLTEERLAAPRQAAAGENRSAAEAGTGGTGAEPPIFSTHDVVCEFRLRRGLFGPVRHIKAVNGVSVELNRGEVLAVVGESGSGKSTLAKLLLGLQEPTGGEIRFQGKSLSQTPLRERARHVQAVFQDPHSSLNPSWTIGKIIRRPLDIHGVGDGRSRRAAVEEMMALVGLAPRYYHSFPSQMSGGQRQRVAIARAIIMKPGVLICDEPTSALDVSVQAQILNLLLDLRERLGLTYIIISHDLSVVRYMATRVAVMYAGEIVEIGPTDRIFDHPQHPYTRTLLASILGLPTRDLPQAAGAARADV